MQVTIRLGRGEPLRRNTKGKNRHIASAISMLLAPAALTAFMLALWRLASDMSAAGRFGIQGGPFSHWQVWFVVAGVIALAAWSLNRYGRGGPLSS